MGVTRDIAAAEVTVGSVWFVWGRHQEVVERREQHPHVAEWQDNHIPAVRLCPLDNNGQRLKPNKMFVAAWRLSKYGVPSEAYSAGEGA